MKPLVIAASDLKRFIRDRTALFFTAALPVAIILVVGTATAGFDDRDVAVGVVDAGGGEFSEDLLRDLEDQAALRPVHYSGRTDLARDVRRGVVPAGIVIPDDYDESLATGEPVTVELLVDQMRGSAAEVRAMVSRAIGRQGGLLQATAFASRHSGVPVEQAAGIALQARDQMADFAVEVEAVTVGRAPGNGYLAPGIGYQAPSNLILFVFLTSIAGSALIIQARQQRVLQRMFATPTSVRSILLGQGLARFSIAGLQALFILIVGAVVFGVRWGQPLGAAALILVFVFVGTSVGMLFGTIFATPDQAGTIGPMAGIAMGMLGGCMWPLEIVPDAMRIAGHAFPHAWAMNAWIELIGRGGTIGDIATELLVLTGYVAVLLPIGVWRLRKALVD